MTFAPSVLFVGFACGFFFGSLTALIRFIITSVVHWMKG